MSAVGVMVWDWQDQPDVEQLDRILANLTNCRVRVFAVDAGGDQFAIVVAAAGDEQQTAGIDHRAAFDHWEATEGRADIFGWPLPVESSGSSSGSTT